MITLENRLDELALLEDGWLNGNDGYRVYPEAMEKCRQIVCLLQESGYPLPWAGPSLDYPGIHLNWNEKNTDPSYDFDRIDITCEFVNSGELEVFFIEFGGKNRYEEKDAVNVSEMFEIITIYLGQFGLIANSMDS